MRVAYTSRSEARYQGGEAMSLDRLLTTSDVVSLHVPLAPETRHLIDKRAARADEAVRVPDQHVARPGGRRRRARLGAGGSG